jgi:hypothetical protein
MADIREILAALSPEDRAVYTQHRNEMRRSYLLAHNETIGMEKWSEKDDQFLDYVDIMLALLYDRAGKLAATKDIFGKDKEQFEEKIDSEESNLKKVDNAAAKMPDIGWSNGKGAH